MDWKTHRMINLISETGTWFKVTGYVQKYTLALKWKWSCVSKNSTFLTTHKFIVGGEGGGGGGADIQVGKSVEILRRPQTMVEKMK
jgi:hypothetical protein